MGTGQREVGTAARTQRLKLRSVGLILAGYLIIFTGLNLMIGFSQQMTPLVFWLWCLVPTLMLASRWRELWGIVRPVWMGARGEVHVARILRPLRDEGYVVLHDLWIDGRNIDHVVVGPTGAFAVETKAWVHAVLRDGRLVHPVFGKDAVGQALAEAMAVKGRLAEAGVDTFVIAVVALSIVTPTTPRAQIGTVDVMPAPDLVAHVRERSPRLTPDEITRATNVLSAFVRT